MIKGNNQVGAWKGEKQCVASIARRSWVDSVTEIENESESAAVWV